MNNKLLNIIVVLAFAAAAVGWTEQDPGVTGGVNVARAIDQKLEQLTISDLEIADALADIGKQVGVPIILDDASAELLPWGRQTKLRGVTITNMSLREALPQILGAVGLMYEIRDTGVFVYATPPLTRLGRRASWEDLKLLRYCYETPYTPENFAALKIQYRITSKVDAQKMLQHQLAQAGSGSIADMLETATASLGWIWLPEEDHLVIRTGQAQVANKLARHVTARYANQPLAQILMDLAGRADIVLTLEPGVLTKLPPMTAQNYSLQLSELSVRQALELICADTGLKYEIRNDGVHIAASDALGESSKPGTPRPSPYVAKISVPGGDGKYTLEFLIRADELPADVLQVRDQMLEEIILRMRRELAPAEETPAGGTNQPKP